MSRAMLVTCWAALSGTLLALAWVFWSLLWPFNLLETEPGAWNIINKDKTAHYGEAVVVNWRGCRYTDLPAYLTTELYGNLLLSLPPRESSTPPGCHSLMFPIVRVGPEVPPGKYTARVIILFHVNPLRDVTYIGQTDEFWVVP